MTLHRSPFLPALAASVSVLLLAGCPNAGTAPPTAADAKFASASPSAAVSAVPSAAASGAASAAPSAAPTTASGTSPSPSATTGASASPGATARPTPVKTENPAPTGEKTILQGKVFDEEGATVDNAVVTVKSLDTRQAYSATATSSQGSYVVNNVPVGVQIEVSVTRAGWTTRRRVTSLQANVSKRNTLDFGSVLTTTNSDDPTGAAFFISNYPEIQSATPGASPITGDKLTYKVRFSEPLDEDNRDLVVNSFEIRSAAIARPLIPASQATGQAIIIRESSSFLDESRKATFTWNAEGTELTMTLDAPLRADDNEDKSYTFRLTRRAGDDLIEDEEGKRLGYTETAATDQYNAIKRASLTLSTGSDTAAERWDDTHNKSTSFDVKEDETDPKVTNVRTSRITRSDRSNTEYRRITVEFSEPMRVYPDATGYADSLTTLSNYVFAFSEDNDLDGTDLDDAATAYNTRVEANAGPRLDDGGNLYEKPITFTAQDGTNTANDVLIQPSDSNPNAVEIDIPEAKLPNGLKTLRVKVETNVTDPAGNKVSEKGETSDNLADNIVEGRY